MENTKRATKAQKTYITSQLRALDRDPIEAMGLEEDWFPPGQALYRTGVPLPDSLRLPARELRGRRAA